MADDLEQKICALVSGTFQVPLTSVTSSSSKETVPGWDSFATLHLASALESDLNVTLTIDEISELVSVGAILKLLRARGVK